VRRNIKKERSIQFRLKVNPTVVCVWGVGGGGGGKRRQNKGGGGVVVCMLGWSWAVRCNLKVNTKQIHIKLQGFGEITQHGDQPIVGHRPAPKTELGSLLSCFVSGPAF